MSKNTEKAQELSALLKGTPAIAANVVAVGIQGYLGQSKKYVNGKWLPQEHQIVNNKFKYELSPGRYDTGKVDENGKPIYQYINIDVMSDHKLEYVPAGLNSFGQPVQISVLAYGRLSRKEYTAKNGNVGYNYTMYVDCVKRMEAADLQAENASEPKINNYSSSKEVNPDDLPF